MTKFDHNAIEKKWSQVWSDENLNKAVETPRLGLKKYILDMWPYPSGLGLHVGHVEGYTGTDIVARYSRMKGFDVLHPIGWDAFGLPAENYAIKTGVAPQELTHKSIATFKKQIDEAGLSYDWSRELNSSDPDYYKWTQWLFILLYKRGLAYKKKAPANWCPSCETVLANEQVVNGHCERCDTQVERKDLDQWFFKITDYADKLIEGLDRIDWPASTKAIQKNWIGKSQGHKVKFGDIEVFTTRIDTLRGATFLALAPDHPRVIEITTPEKRPQIEQFAKTVSTQDYKEVKDKAGIFTGYNVVNPVTGKSIPVWVVNYVSSDYGTGAIMGVPALDERDREFATKYQIDILDIVPDVAMEKYGTPFVSYHLRDWLISRQRYWGAPIPMIFCDKCGWQPVPEDQLPIKLPTDVDFRPTGESPIARSQVFQNGAVCPECGAPAKREVDTIDTFVDSSWYFLRFADPKNQQMIFDRQKVDAWHPVDLYVGGEHATTHLIFSRFLVKVLYDAGLIGFDEPFLKLRMVGIISGEDGRKMSKRWGNIVNPDDVINKFGADTLRMYEMFMGPFSDAKSWNTAGVEGVNRFLNRLYKLFESTYQSKNASGKKLELIANTLVGQITKDIEDMTFNTAVSAMMETLNSLVALKENSEAGDWAYLWEKFTLVLAPFAPFVAEEMYQMLHAEQPYKSVHTQVWPEYDPKLSASLDVTIVVQVNGNMRDRLVVPANYSTDQKYVEQLAVSSAKVQKYLNGAKTRTIFVPGKIINLVII